MNSRERILNAIERKPVDKVPVDLGGHRSSGIAAIAYAQLKKELGITTGDIYVYDVIQQLAIVEQPVLERFQVDTIEMGRGFCLDKKDWKDWILPNGIPCKIPANIHIEKRNDDWYLLSESGIPMGVQKKGVLYFEQIYFPCLENDFSTDDFSHLEESMKKCMWTSVPSPSSCSLDEVGLKELETKAKQLRESTDKAIIGLFGGNLFELPQYLYRSDNYFLALAMYPDKIIELSEKLTNIYIKKLEKWLGAVGKYIDIVLFGDDFGSNNGPLIDPQMYREFYKPFHKKMWTRTKEIADVKIQLHSCGSIEPLLTDLIDAGLDMVNPVQINALNMNPVLLKSKYGKDFCFWGGGCNTQQILNLQSPDVVEKSIKELLPIWTNGSGYVFQQVHNIMADIKPENIIRMFDTVNNFRLQ